MLVGVFIKVEKGIEIEDRVVFVCKYFFDNKVS